jgi:hypothetical protein
VPTADEITVRQVLEKFDGEFNRVAEAVANGEFALWIGSGISRKAPSLGDLVDQAVEYLRVSAVDPATRARFLPALREALEIADLDPSALEVHFGTPFVDWPTHNDIREILWNRYSRLLDVRVRGEAADFMLWEAIDIRTAFADPARPAAEHLGIAVLVLEGAVREMASANWDGFIETAVSRLTGGAPGVLQAVVDPNHLRNAAGAARLLKFHGCIVHATAEPAVFREYLTGSHTQIVDWVNKPLFAGVRAAVGGLAANNKALVTGLSIQDANLQGVFAAARQANPWPWPPDPDAQGHVFCEDSIRVGQRDILRLIYGEAYNQSPEGIAGSAHMRAWPEQVLIALVLNVIERKLAFLLQSTLNAAGKDTFAADLSSLLTGLRNDVADLATWNPDDKSRTGFAYSAISVWSRILAIFRTGRLPVNPDEYQAVSASGLRQLAADDNALAAGLGNFATGLAMLQHGKEQALWTFGTVAAPAIENGAIVATGTWGGAVSRPVFLVKGISEALNLQQTGALDNDNAVVIHADKTWSQVMGSSGGSRSLGSAPGRTGRSATRHVCMESLLERCDTMAILEAEFTAEASI